MIHKITSGILILLLMQYCNIMNRVEKENNFVNIESFIDLKLRDSLGNNVLKSNFTIDIIHYDKEGKEHIYFDKEKQASKGYIIINNGEFVRLFLNLPKSEKNTSKTYVRFNNGSIDVFKTEYNINPARTNIVRNKIWINKDLIWDIDNSTKIPTLIIK